MWKTKLKQCLSWIKDNTSSLCLTGLSVSNLKFNNDPVPYFYLYLRNNTYTWETIWTQLWKKFRINSAIKDTVLVLSFTMINKSAIVRKEISGYLWRGNRKGCKIWSHKFQYFCDSSAPCFLTRMNHINNSCITCFYLFDRSTGLPPNRFRLLYDLSNKCSRLWAGTV